MEDIKDLATKCAMAVQVQSPQIVEIVYIMLTIIYLVYAPAIAITMVIIATSFSSELCLKNSAILDAVAVSVWILKIALNAFPMGTRTSMDTVCAMRVSMDHLVRQPSPWGIMKDHVTHFV